MTGFLGTEDPEAAPVLEARGLRVASALPRIPLAMKVRSHRVGEDEADVRLLVGALG